MPPWTPTPGTFVSSTVRLLEPLGRGGMGSVWVAEHVTLQTRVAVKFISTDVPPSVLPSLLARFEREARSAAKIRSPHVVDVRDFGSVRNGVPYLIMELLHGQSLARAISGGRRLALPMIESIVSQTAKGLTAAHAVGIRHRDVKPDNIFLVQDEDGVLVKLLDFGIAKADGLEENVGSLTGTTAVLGTPDYMSPEQLLSPKSADHRVDLWGLAVVAYQMLTGQLPYRGETVGALAVAVQAGAFVRPSSIDPSLPRGIDAWFERCLHPDPAVRFQSAKELAATFREATAGGGAVGGHMATIMGQPSLRAGADGASSVRAPLPSVSSDPGVRASLPSYAPIAPPRSSSASSAKLNFANVDDSRQATVAGAPPLNSPSAAMMSSGQPSTDRGASRTIPPLPAAHLARAGRKSSGLASKLREHRIEVALGLVAFALSGAIVGIYLARIEPDQAPPPREKSTSAEPARKAPPPTPAAPAGMVSVRGGRYEIGCNAGIPGCGADAQPKHTVDLPSFALDSKEVTMGQYDECVAAGKCPPAGKTEGCTWQKDGKEAFPINCVTWSAADAYCKSNGLRLPTEPEWEVAARGPKMTEYPWGMEPLPELKSAPLASAGARPKDRSWIGALDLAGNVREWTASDYAAYPTSRVVTEKRGKVVRGGSFRDRALEPSRTHGRAAEATTKADVDLGFRCAVTL